MDSDSCSDVDESEDESDQIVETDSENDEVASCYSDDEINDENNETSLPITTTAAASFCTDERNILEQSRSLVQKIRKLIKFICKSNVVNSFLVAFVKSKEKSLVDKKLVLDMAIRWNSTSLMLKRFILFKKVVTHLIQNRTQIQGLKQTQITKLSQLEITQIDWDMVISLIRVLQPFYTATMSLSGRDYSTIALSYITKKHLLHFLSNSTELKKAKKIDLNANEYNVNLENILKRGLLKQFNLTMDSKVSEKQKQNELVSIILFLFKFLFGFGSK